MCRCQECCTRLCLGTGQTTVSVEEGRALGGLGAANKQLVVQRATMLSLVIFVQVVQLVTDVITGVQDLQAVDAVFEDKLVHEYLVGLVAGLAAYRGVVLLTTVAARILWADFRRSSAAVLGGYAIKVLMPTALFFVPFRDLISEMGVNLAILAALGALMVSMLMPNLLTVQTIIGQANGLVATFPAAPEFRIAAGIVLIFYIPVFIIACGLLFQFGFVYDLATEMMAEHADGPAESFEPVYNMEIIGFMILYLAYILVPNLTWARCAATPVTAQRRRMALQVALGEPCVVLLYRIMASYGSNLLLTILSGYLESVYVGVALSDVLMNLVGRYSGSLLISDMFGEDRGQKTALLSGDGPAAIEVASFTGAPMSVPVVPLDAATP